MAKYVVRYGAMRHLSVMSRPKSVPAQRGTRVIVRTDRGLEVGEILCEATEQALAQLPASSGTGQIQREVTEDDQQQWEKIQSLQAEEYDVCWRCVEESQLPMDLVEVEHLFGGERIVVYYLAENRVDFRALVRKLAEELQTRIEMRQIGVRDEAKLLADYGDCGKPVCCNTHLASMPPVSMKMAKLQKATLDPTKISGRCGRLKCCLRYEYDVYNEMRKELPPVGSDIVTAQGRGRVLAQEILASQVLVEMENHRRMLVHAPDVLSVLKKGNDRARRRPSEESS